MPMCESCGRNTSSRPARLTWVDSRAPLVPIGSLITCTSRDWPSCRMRSIGLLSSRWPFWRCSQMSAMCRNAARSRPLSMHADCMPGNPRAPVGVASDRGTSRVRSQYLQPDLGQDLGGFEKRQPHHSRIAALEMAYECRGPALDCIGAGLVEGLAGGDIAFDLVIDQRTKC